MGEPAKYWPGGIPEHVKFHPCPVLKDLCDEVKGWQLFLEENAIPRDTNSQDGDAFEVNQRRQLVDRWALISQEEREAYQSRAPLRDRASWYPQHLRDKDTNRPTRTRFVNYIAAWPMDARNKALWTKLRIMLYSLDGDNGTIFSQVDDGDSEFTVVEPNPAKPNPVAPQEFLKWRYIENALFDNIAMTSTGTVICHRWRDTVLFVDQEALDTGLMFLCQLKNNGQLVEGNQARVLPLQMKRPYRLLKLDYKPIEELLTMNAVPDQRMEAHYRVNMEDPILDILEYSIPNPPDSDLWLEAIERCAPGYLEMESQGSGMVSDYDHSRFRTDKELEDLPWSDEVA